jgi:hypothetical protein
LNLSEELCTTGPRADNKKRGVARAKCKENRRIVYQRIGHVSEERTS